MSDNNIPLPEGVATFTLDGEYPHTTYRLGDTVIASAQPSIANRADFRQRHVVTVVHDSDGLDGRHAVVRVSPEQLPSLLAVLTDLHRSASRAHLQVVPE